MGKKIINSQKIILIQYNSEKKFILKKNLFIKQTTNLFYNVLLKKKCFSTLILFVSEKNLPKISKRALYFICRIIYVDSFRNKLKNICVVR